MRCHPLTIQAFRILPLTLTLFHYRTQFTKPHRFYLSRHPSSCPPLSHPYCPLCMTEIQSAVPHCTSPSSIPPPIHVVPLVQGRDFSSAHHPDLDGSPCNYRRSDSPFPSSPSAPCAGPKLSPRWTSVSRTCSCLGESDRPRIGQATRSLIVV